MTTKLDYISGASILNEGDFGISPSNVYNFFNTPGNWYREQILGENGFTGSTSSVLGTIVHYCVEEYATTKTVDVKEIYKYIFKECVLMPSAALIAEFEALIPETGDLPEEDLTAFIKLNSNNPDIDSYRIFDQWRIMGQTLINSIIAWGIPYRCEELIKAEIRPGYWVSGSADAVSGTDDSACLQDYKTTSLTTAPTKIPYHYRHQLLTYAYIYNKLGIKVNRIAIIWITNNIVGRVSEKTGKPLKDYPCEVTKVEETVSAYDLQWIERELQLIADTVIYSKQHPGINHILFKDQRLIPSRITF